MLAPTPLLRPSPLDISGLFAGSFDVLKRRFGLLVLLALFPLLVAIVALSLVVIPFLGMFATIATAGRGAVPAIGAELLLMIVLAIAAGVLSGLAQLKSYGMMAVAAYEIAQGGHPDFRGLWTRTRGFLPRMMAVILIIIGLLIVFYAPFFGFAFALVGALDGSSGGRSAGVAVVIMLLILLMIPLAIFLQTKLLYTVPAAAIEQVGGIEALKRSWRLTSGAFWRTLGYYLIAGLTVGAASSVVSVVGQLILAPATMGMQNSSDPGAAMASLLAALPLMLVVFGLQLALQLVAQPFVQTYLTFMFIDQVRRSELPPTPASGYPAGPQGGYYAPPAQYYGQPGQGYGQPGQPPQGYPPAPPAQPPQPGGWQPPQAPRPS